MRESFTLTLAAGGSQKCHPVLTAVNVHFHLGQGGKTKDDVVVATFRDFKRHKICAALSLPAAHADSNTPAFPQNFAGDFPHTLNHGSFFRERGTQLGYCSHRGFCAA